MRLEALSSNKMDGDEECPDLVDASPLIQPALQQPNSFFPASEETAMKKIPVTIVTGFLGPSMPNLRNIHLRRWKDNFNALPPHCATRKAHRDPAE